MQNNRATEPAGDVPHGFFEEVGEDLTMHPQIREGAGAAAFPEDPAVRAALRAHAPGGPGGMNLDDSIYNRLLRERIVFLGSEVKDANANAICAQLLLLDAEDSDRDIWLYINSPGGSVDSGMAIYDTMQFVHADVATVAMGLAASMGQVLLSAGAAGKRYALPHARIMMHQASGGIGGTASDIRIQAEQAILLKREMAQIIADHTGQTIEQIQADAERDRWFTAEQAKSYGFVDHVVRSAGQVAGGGGTE